MPTNPVCILLPSSGSAMKILLLPFIILPLFTGFEANALTAYDYTATIECLANPLKPQYGGGIIINPEFNHGQKGWTTFGNAEMEQRESKDGNKFIVAHSRNQSYDSISQKLYLDENKLYTFSAWLQVSEGTVLVTAAFKTSTGFKYAGATIAESNCWSMLKGGLTVDASGSADLYFESKNTSVEIWVDSISLQPFTQEEWRLHQDQSIEKTRKSRVRIRAVDTQCKPLANATITIRQKRPRFPFGCASNKNILNNRKYQQWFSSRFAYTTFENEMKWYSTEVSPGKENYSVPDAMLRFMKQHKIAVRGHNILWDVAKYQPSWVKSLSQKELKLAAERRIRSVVSRYKGKVIGWDVVNENLHNDYFESKLGEHASALFFKYAHLWDLNTLMFMNEYNTIENSGDQASTPAKYLHKLREIQSYTGQKVKLAIGLESHFGVPNLPYMRASLDTLAAAGLPIWLTEVDVKKVHKQAVYLEQILREGHGHPNVSGMIIWSAWWPNSGCYAMCLTDDNFRNLPSGDVVDKLLHEWSVRKLVGTTDADGFFEAALFLGNYEVKIIHPSAIMDSSLSHSFKVTPNDLSGQTAMPISLSFCMN